MFFFYLTNAKKHGKNISLRSQKSRDCCGPWHLRHLHFFTNHLKLVNPIRDDWDIITEEDIQVVQGFVCAMHGKKRFQSVDELRLELFLTKLKYKPNNDSLVDKVRKLDSVTLPICSRVVFKKLKRSNYIARLWGNCLNANPRDQNVLSFGWRMKDGRYKIQWFDGDAAPKIVDVVHQCEGILFEI